MPITPSQWGKGLSPFRVRKWLFAPRGLGLRGFFWGGDVLIWLDGRVNSIFFFCETEDPQAMVFLFGGGGEALEEIKKLNNKKYERFPLQSRDKKVVGTPAPAAYQYASIRTKLEITSYKINGGIEAGRIED